VPVSTLTFPVLSNAVALKVVVPAVPFLVNVPLLTKRETLPVW
jgi:hypothetical protein